MGGEANSSPTSHSDLTSGRGWRPVLAPSRKNRSHVQAAILASTCLVRGEDQCLSNTSTCHTFLHRGIRTAPGHSPSDQSRSWRPKQVTVFSDRSISLPLTQAPVLSWRWGCGRGGERGLFFVKNKDLHNLLSADPVTCSQHLTNIWSCLLSPLLPKRQMLRGNTLGRAVATGRLGVLGGGADKLCPPPWHSVHHCLSLPCSGPSLDFKRPLLLGGEKTSSKILVQRTQSNVSKQPLILGAFQRASMSRFDSFKMQLSEPCVT